MFLKLRTYIYLASALSLVFAIYFFENKVDKIRSEIAEKKSNMEKYKQEIIMLEAEWSYQNNPERLAELMFRLNWENPMQTPEAIQFSELNNLPYEPAHLSSLDK